MIWFKLALRSFFKNKAGFLLIFVLMIGIVTIVTTNMTTSRILDGMQQVSFHKYGSFHGMFSDLNAEQINELKESPSISKVGEISLFGTAVDFNGKGFPVTVGSMNQEAVEMNGIQLKEGRFPKKENEIAIEAFLADGRISIHPNYKLKIKNFGDNKLYTVVGIIENYTYNRSFPEKVERGKNDYPNILMSEAFRQQNQINSVIFYLSLSHDEVQNEFYRLKDKFQRNESNSTLNRNLFERESKYYTNIQFLSVTFSVFLWIGTYISCYQVFGLFYRASRKNVGIFMSLGATRVHIYWLVLWQIFIAFFSSLLASVPIIFFLQKGLEYQHYFELTKISLLYGNHTYLAFIWLGILFCSMLLVGWIFIKKLEKNEIFMNMKNINPFLRRIGIYKKLSEFPFLCKYFLIQILARWKSGILVIFILNCAVFILFFSHLIAGESKSGFYNESAEYFLTAKQFTYLDGAKGFEIDVNQPSYFTYEAINEIEKLSGVRTIIKRPYQQGTTFLLEIDQMPLQFQEWYKTYQIPDIYAEISRQEVNRLPLSDKKPMPYVRFVLLQDQAHLALQKKYGITKSIMESFDENFSALLFLPDFLPRKVEQTAFRSIDLARIEKNAETKNLQYKQWSVDVLQIVRQPYELAFNGGVESHRSSITVVIDETQARHRGIFKGYESINVVMEEDTDSEQTQKVENHLQTLMMSMPGSWMQSINDEIKRDHAVAAYLFFIGKVSFGIAWLFAVVAICVLMYMRIIDREREFALNQVMGMQSGVIIKLFMLEIVVYVSIASIFSGAVLLGIMYATNSIQGYEGYAIYYSASLLFIWVCSFVALFIPYKYLRSSAIMDKLQRSRE